MKRISMFIATMTLLISVAHAYNPPVGAEEFYDFSSARIISGGNSAAGGALFYANPASVVINPALNYNEQRVSLNAGFTGLFSTYNPEKVELGNAFQLGITIPFKWAIFTGYLNGITCNFDDINLGKSINTKFALSKEVTDKLSVGLSLNTGFFWSEGSDWSLSTNLGFLYNYGDLGFIKDFRFAGSILNLGKNYSNTSVHGADLSMDSGIFPSICLIKAGAAGQFINNDIIKFGFSLDASTPLLQNFIFDVGLQLGIKDFLVINIGESINIDEIGKGYQNYIPSLGITAKFKFGITNSNYAEKQGWTQSELAATFAYNQLYSTLHAVSGEVDVNLGTKDETPPVITLWPDEGDE